MSQALSVPPNVRIYDNTGARVSHVAELIDGEVLLVGEDEPGTVPQAC